MLKPDWPARPPPTSLVPRRSSPLPAAVSLG
jgi:hypothetical protein